MKITITRLGGFAGITETLASLDTSEFAPGIAEQLKQHVRTLAAIFAGTPQPLGKDQFRYEIQIVELGSAPRTLTVIDEGRPDAPTMKALSALLALAARHSVS